MSRETIGCLIIITLFAALKLTSFNTPGPIRTPETRGFERASKLPVLSLDFARYSKGITPRLIFRIAAKTGTGS